MEDELCPPDDTDVIILVDASGEIINCIDARRCRTLQHVFMVQHSTPHLRLLSSKTDSEEEDDTSLAIHPVFTISISPSSNCLLFDLYNHSPHQTFGIDQDAYCEGFMMTEVVGQTGTC